MWARTSGGHCCGCTWEAIGEFCRSGLRRTGANSCRTAVGLPAVVAFAGQCAVSPPLTTQQLAVGRKLAQNLLEFANHGGLPAVRAACQQAPQPATVSSSA